MSGAIGFLGLGTMGRRMAVRLVRGDTQVVVWSRTSDHTRLLADLGATVVDSPSEIVGRCAFVFSCLLDTAVVEAVYAGRQGLLASARPRQVFVEHGTFDPVLARRLAALASARDAAFLDAPVSGGPEGADEGALVAMVGGDEAALDRARPLIGRYAQEVLRVGGPGRGLELKLVNQLLVGCHVVAAAEAAALIRTLNLPLDVSERLLMSGWASSAMLGRSLSRAVRREDEATGAGVGGLIEAQQLIAGLARQTGLQLRLHPTVQSVFVEAVEAGLAKRDLAAVARMFDDQSGGPE
jgi:3-hydroxyisobutyrate dehydrogenase-like beta-hydroxyacid dehydrogenase